METSYAASSQYHHFVPQFLLKNFAHPYIPQKAGSPTSISRPNGELGKKMYRGDLVVNCLNLSSETPEIMETSVKRVLGQTDMYRDTNRPYPEQYIIEEMLSRLESKASTVFRKITKSFDGDHRGVWFTRNERNLIRKFLFLMKYRGSTFHQRFYHETATGYEANDRDRLLEYMREKGFERPIDVWLDNIRTIIDLEMDDELKWISKLPERMYPDDAKWFILNCQSMYMALCTPSDPKDEFVLTDNSYHVFEGPGQVLTDLNTGKSQEMAWISFHEFAPISPKLMIVLRSFILPSPLEDANPKVKACRDIWWSLTVEKIFESGTNSLLADLPIKKAGNNYTEILNGRLQLIPSEDGSLRQNHKFFFSFFPIDTSHVNKINGIFLDNASVCNSVVFRSAESFRRSLEWYITEPCQVGKRVTSAPGDQRLRCLMKLAAVLKQMGSDKDPVWEEIPFPELDNDEKCQLMLKELRQLLPLVLQHLPDDNPTEFMKVYKTLGGSKETLPKDMEQAELMMKLRIKIDVWSSGIDERLRQKNREVLIETYLQFPSRRVWFYLKHWRNTILQDLEDPPLTVEHIYQQQLDIDGPEDVVAKAQCIIKPSKLNILMYTAVGNDIETRKSPGFNLWSKITFDQSGLEHFGKLQKIAFNGNIRDCGIEEIEKLATFHQVMAKRSYKSPITRESNKQIFTEDEKTEILARMMVRQGFKSALAGRLETDLLNDLAKTFFEVIYPTPPIREAEK